MLLSNKPTAIVWGLDGVIADLNGRSPHKVEKCLDDKIYSSIYAVFLGMGTGVTDVVRRIILSGRYESCRSDTESWLRAHRYSYEELILRDVDNDPRVRGMPNQEYKRLMYVEKIEPKYNVILAIDDRPSTIQMWQERGIDSLMFCPGASVIAETS